MLTKKTKIKSLRNVLESPFHIHWTDKSAEETLPIQNALKEILPAAKLEQTHLKLQFKEIKKKKNEVKTKKNKNEVKTKKKKNEVKTKKRQCNEYRSNLTPGFQSVIRALEKKELCCVVMSSDVSPNILQKVVLTYAHTANVPVTIVPDLKMITRCGLGFPSMVLGFKNIVAESPNNKFYPVYKMISQNPVIIETPFIRKENKDTDKTNMNQDEDGRDKLITESSKLPQLKRKSLYLYRDGNEGRVFIPKRKTIDETIMNSESKEQKNDEFISLEETPSASSNIKKRRMNFTSYSNNDADDDPDSDNEISFFVDNKPDYSLLQAEELQVEKSGALNTSSYTKNPPKEFQKASLNNTVTHQKIELGNKLKSDVHKHKNIKHKTNSKNTIKYKPLQIKSVTSNPKKLKRKKKTLN